MNTKMFQNQLVRIVAGWALVATLLVGTTMPTQAKSLQAIPDAPLFPGLTWDDAGAQEQTIAMGEQNVTLTGQQFTAQELINLDAESSNELLAFYSSDSMLQAGWALVSTIPADTSTTKIYHHADGYLLKVVFQSCETDSALACVSVWLSEQSDATPATSAEPTTPEIQAVGTLNKSTPANGSTNLNNTSITLTWTKYTGTDLDRYRYCIDTTNNSSCENAGNWTNAWGSTSVTVNTLAANTTYYWQVQAVLDDNTKVDANTGTWWSFSTTNTQPPANFNKLFPANNAVNQSSTPALTWQSSPTATSYAYCIDTNNNALCDNNWISTGTNTYVALLAGLNPNTTYYWQVRAANAINTTLADVGAWYTFTTGSPLANDFMASAATITIPFSQSLDTIPATIDSGTENACSPGLGYASVWYKYTPTANSKLYMDTLGTNYDTFIAVWRQNFPSNTLVLCNDDISTTVKQSSINLTMTAGTIYYIQVAQKNPNTTPTAIPGGTLKVQARSFLDVPGNSIYWPFIESLYKSAITGGCATSPDLLYCPANQVNRAEMAVFLLKGIHGSAYVVPAVGSSTGFSDVPTSHWAAAWIKQLASEGITGGCGDGTTYCPAANVTRAQMAVFLLKAKYGSAYIPPALVDGTGFGDVATDYWAATWIKQLAAEGITGGCGGGNYCPEATVTREQMAIFLVRTFNLP